MLICLMRHGEAETFSSDGSDETRRLTERGQAGNAQVAGQLAARQASFDHYWVSPYVRAQQTADAVLSHYPAAERQLCELLTPESDPIELLNALEASGHGSLLLIGHNPLLSRVAALLVDGSTAINRNLTTSELLAIETDVVAPACGVIKYSLIP